MKLQSIYIRGRWAGEKAALIDVVVLIVEGGIDNSGEEEGISTSVI